jgi:ABC-type nitrate/sulfonate/bicarbonate transport system substrate-binding protein
MMKKIFVGIGVVLIGVAVIAVMYQKKADVPQGNKEKVIVLLDWFPNTNHTGIYVAKTKGYFDGENLDVTLLEPGESETLKSVAMGNADFAVSSQESVTMAQVAGIPVVSVAAIIQHNTSAFASLDATGIKTVKDFEGKRYGGWGSPIEEAVLQAVMADAHADYKKLKNITIGESDFFKTIGRDSDFQWIFYGWDGVEAQRKGISLHTIMLKDLNPILDYYTPVLVTGENQIKTKPETIKKFMRAVKQGYEYAIDYPPESAQILIDAVPEINADLVRLSQEYLSRQYQSDAPSWGRQEVEVWQRYGQWLFDHKLIDKPFDSDKAFTNDFIR